MSNPQAKRPISTCKSVETKGPLTYFWVVFYGVKPQFNQTCSNILAPRARLESSLQQAQTTAWDFMIPRKKLTELLTHDSVCQMGNQLCRTLTRLETSFPSSHFQHLQETPCRLITRKLSSRKSTQATSSLSVCLFALQYT